MMPLGDLLAAAKLTTQASVDAAIARQKEELSRLEAAVSTDKKLLQGVAVSADASSTAAITETPAKKAGTKKRTKNVRAKAPPKAT